MRLYSRPAARAAVLTVLLLTCVAVREALGVDSAPPNVLAFSRGLPAIFEELGNVVAREEMVQQVFRERRLFDVRTLVSDYQVAHLDADPTALWEFRFVRSVNGRRVRDTDRRVSDFLLLRHTDAREERLRLTRLASDHSLPHCYWHNLTLALDAFTEGLIDDYDWTETAGGARFRQVRGLGIREDFFNSQSPRHYPEGELVLAGPGHQLERLTLEFPSEDVLVRISLRFAPSGLPGGQVLPREYEVVRIRRETGEVATRTTLRYSDFRRFSVGTEEKTGNPVEK